MRLLTALLAIGCVSVDPAPSLPDVQVDCTPSRSTPEDGIVGLSDPNTVQGTVIDLVEDSGVRWVRAEIHWSVVQPDPGGALDFSAYDSMIAAYRERGVQVQAILTYIPPAYGQDWDEIEAGFERFATEAVRRYASQGVHHWEIFNEPNLTGYGWLSEGEAVRENLPNYVRLLAIGNRVVRDEDPDGFVLIGGIASEQHRGLALEETMDVVYGYDAGDCFDIMAFHPYGYQNRFADARNRVQETLDAHGDGDKPVWFNEYGWTDYRSMDLSVNDTVATNPMMAVFDQRDTADALFWFSAKDYSRRASAPTFGLADFDGNKRASFDTFKALVAGDAE